MGDFRCGDCGRPMVAPKIHSENPAGWRARGYVRHNAGDLCIGCYARHRRHGTLTRRYKIPVPEVSIAVTYAIGCAACGDLGTVTNRAEAKQLRDEHAATHRPERPSTRGPLGDAEIVRLRAAVGIRGAA